MELEIKGKIYPLKATFRFLEAIEKKTKIHRNDIDVDLGLIFSVSQMQEGDMRSLRDILIALNTGQSPRLQESLLESWLEEECEDPDELINEVLDFLSKANVCKKKMKNLLQTMEETPNLSA